MQTEPWELHGISTAPTVPSYKYFFILLCWTLLYTFKISAWALLIILITNSATSEYPEPTSLSCFLPHGKFQGEGLEVANGGHRCTSTARGGVPYIYLNYTRIREMAKHEGNLCGPNCYSPRSYYAAWHFSKIRFQFLLPRKAPAPKQPPNLYTNVFSQTGTILPIY